MDLLTLVYRGVYDSLATVDISGGVLLAAIWLQTGYVALFRAIHGRESGRAPAPARRRSVPPPAAPKPGPASSSSSSSSPWGAR